MAFREVKHNPKVLGQAGYHLDHLDGGYEATLAYHGSAKALPLRAQALCYHLSSGRIAKIPVIPPLDPIHRVRGRRVLGSPLAAYCIDPSTWTR